MSKRTMAGDYGERFAVMLGGGSYVVADPQAPLEHGCPCALQVDAGKWLTGAMVVTKHPMRAKVLRIAVDGSMTVRVKNRKQVARIVGKFIATRWRDLPDCPLPARGKQS